MSQEQPSPDITTLLQGAQAGHAESQQRLAEAVYTQLRHIANERSSHTLQPTALVNEAYIRLFFNRQVQWENRDHFFAIAASQIRRILILSARSPQTARRGGNPLEIHHS